MRKDQMLAARIAPEALERIKAAAREMSVTTGQRVTVSDLLRLAVMLACDVDVILPARRRRRASRGADASGGVQ
jgi:hypothetical protein